MPTRLPDDPGTPARDPKDAALEKQEAQNRGLRLGIVLLLVVGAVQVAVVGAVQVAALAWATGGKKSDRCVAPFSIPVAPSALHGHLLAVPAPKGDLEWYRPLGTIGVADLRDGAFFPSRSVSA